MAAMPRKPLSTAPHAFQRGIQLICFSKMTSLIWAAHPTWQTVLSVSSHPQGAQPTLTFMLTVLLCTIAFLVFLLWHMSQSRAWAIWTWTVLTVLGVALVGFEAASAHQRAHLELDGWLKWFTTLCDLLGTALLWLPSARRHWRSRAPAAPGVATPREAAT